MLKVNYLVFDENDVEVMKGKEEFDLDVQFEDGKFPSDLWNEVVDKLDWPGGERARLIVTLQSELHVETMAHNSDEGWLTYGEDPGFGLWDYSGDVPRQIAKLGEEVK
jgi:hypothetical protein